MSIAAVLGVGIVGTAPSIQDPMTSTDKDREIVKEIATINLSEIELGKLAYENGTSSFGKTYGERMMHDHKEAQSELESIASRMEVYLPKGMDSKHQAMWAHLSRTRGAAFDRMYSKDMMMGHEKVFFKFKKWEDEVSDSGLKAYIVKYRPIIQTHQIIAREAYNQKGTSW